MFVYKVRCQVIMKIKLYLSTLFLASVMLLAGCCCNESPSYAPVTQNQNIKKYGDVINGEKPVIVKFNLRGCGACVKVAPIFDAVSEQFAKRAEFVIADADADYELAREYGVRAYPTVFIVKPQSSTRVQIPYEVLFSQETFAQYLVDNLKDYYVKTPEEYYNLAKMHYSKGEYQDALNYYNIVLEFYPDNENLKTAIESTKQKLAESNG